MPHASVLVLTNHALQQLSRGWREREERMHAGVGQSSTGQGSLLACTHRVVRSSAGAVQRLSISYELRPAADATAEAWRAVGGTYD